MAYCDLNDILGQMDEADVIRYTDDAGTGSVNTDAVNKAIAGADAIINGHISARYNVPLSPVPAIITTLAVDIAGYKIGSRRGSAPEDVRKKFEDAVRFLDKVSSGKAFIPGATSAPASASNDAVKITSDTRLFTRSSMGGF